MKGKIKLLGDCWLDKIGAEIDNGQEFEFDGSTVHELILELDKKYPNLKDIILKNGEKKSCVRIIILN